VSPRIVSQDPFRDSVKDLMLNRGWTKRGLAVAVGVDPAHVCRLLKRGTQLRASPVLLARTAAAFDIDPDYFVEYREWRELEAVRRSPSLRERVFAGIAAAYETPSPPRTRDDRTALSGTPGRVAGRTGSWR